MVVVYGKGEKEEEMELPLEISLKWPAKNRLGGFVTTLTARNVRLSWPVLQRPASLHGP